MNTYYVPMGQLGMHAIVAQNHYANYLKSTKDMYRSLVDKKLIPAAELAKLHDFSKAPRPIDISNPHARGEYEADKNERFQYAKTLMRQQVDAYDKAGKYSKAGVTTSLGYNFFDLRAPVGLFYPVNTPFRNTMPREPKVNQGYGTAAHWKATRNFGTAASGAEEGKRGALATPDENDYIATYKEQGIERAVSFTAQFAGEGFTDNVADEHLRGYHELILQEEAMMLLGNSGAAAGNNGFVLGIPTAPVAALAAGTGLADALNVSAFVVAITGLGNPNNAQYGYGVFPSVTAGLTPSYSRTNQDGTTTTINGGTSQISTASNVVVTTGSTHQVKFTTPAIRGAVAWAWYVNITDASAPTTANALLHSITTAPTLTIKANPTGTQAANAAGLNSDHSFNVTDFDGLATYAFVSGTGSGASSSGSYWLDLLGASLTSNKNGTVQEIENVLQYLWQTFQAGVDGIWCSTDTRVSLDQAIRYAGTGVSAYRFEYTRDQQNNLLGGFVVSAYQSKFAINPTGGNAIPINTHPMLPPGTIFFDINVNPYPASRAKFVRGMLTQRDYYSIEWPVVTRAWTFGTYVHEVMQHNFPWLSAMITGVGAFNFSQ